MTSDTFVSLNLADVRCGGNTEKSEAFNVGEANMYPGYIVTLRATTTTIYLYKEQDYVDNGYMPAGVLDLKDGQALDTAYTVTTDQVEIWEVGKGAVVYVHCIAATPAPSYQKGKIITASATDGYGKIFAYTDGTDYLSAPLLAIGHVDEYKAGSTSDTKLVKVVLDL